MALYKYMVLPGNESVLMREALERRSWWEPVDAKADASPKRPIKPEASGRAQKTGVPGSSSKTSHWNFWWGGNGQKFDFTGFDGASKAQQIINRLESHKEVCTKSGLAANLEKVKAAAIKSGAPVGWIPETYVIPAGGSNQAALKNFTIAFERCVAAGKGCIWIVKPTSLNRGKGIEVFNKLDDIKKHVSTRKAGSSSIVQKYIENPLLVQGRKFDLRAYVLVAPDGRVYFYDDAYVRTSSTPYVADDLTDRAAHLTNDAVQKKLDTYHAFEDHCKMSLTQLQDAVTAHNVDVRGGVWPQMRSAVQQLFSVAGADKLNPRRRQYCFELLGLDFMIDTAGQVYLIEVNTSPALFRAGATLAELLPRVIEEVVQKAVDPFLQPPPGVALPPLLNHFELVVDKPAA